MLVLSRKIGEVVTVGSSVKVTVLSFDRGIVRLGIEAPKSIPVHRKEVYDKIIELNRQASKTDLSSLKTAMSKVGLKFRNQVNEGKVAPSLKFSVKKQNIEEEK